MIELKAHSDRHIGPSFEPEGFAVSSCRMPSIVAVTGTFGAEVNNGVGRFLAGLHDWSHAERYSLDVFSAGSHLARYPGVHNVHALAFPVPGGFENIAAYYPLEGRRRQLARAIKDLNPDIVHVSTPEALGASALSIARRQRRLVAGIYHTDFPAFARYLAREAVASAITNGPDPRNGPLGPLWRRLEGEYRAGTRWWERWLAGWVGRRVLRRNRARLDDLIERGSERLAGFAESAIHGLMARFYGRFDLVIARSEIYRRRLIDEMGLHPDRVRTLRAGVDTRVFSPLPGGADDYLRLRLAVPERAKIVLHVGRVTDEKNVGFLADAWRAFRERPGRSEPDAVFVVAGGGNLDGFRRRAGPGVLALGPCGGETLSALYRRADLFWTASTTETLGQVVLEAQSSGLPVLVSDRGAACENVADGETGCVLPVDSPERWADQLARLLGADERRTAMAAAARKLAEERTIEDSYRHYWELHRELATNCQWGGEAAPLFTSPPALSRTQRSGSETDRVACGEQTGRGRGASPRVRECDAPALGASPPHPPLSPATPGERESPHRFDWRAPVEEPITPTLANGSSPAIHLSDFHAGKGSKRIPKVSALRAACQRAVERGARLFLHGDFLDTRPPPHKFRREISIVREVLEEFGVVPELYLEGNHDYEFGRAKQIEDLLRCPTAPSLVHHDPATGLVLTHGHVSEVPGIQQLIVRAHDRDDLVRALSVERLQEPLRFSAFKYDVVGIVTNCLEDAGLDGLEDTWRGGLHARRWLADRLMGLVKKRGLDDHVIRAVVHMIGSSDREEVLSQLCAALGGWGLVYGHTHEPHASRQRVIDPLTGEPRTVLLGNCGSFRRKSVPPTWIESDFPHLELWAFNVEEGVAEMVSRASLTPEEARPYEALRAVEAGCG